MSQADALRKQILALVADYGREASARITFVPGKTTIPPAGKMLGAAEFVNLVDAALDGWLTTGRFNAAFEERLAAYVGVRFALTANSGSSANLLALSALTSPQLGPRALKPGDEVITCAAGFPTTINPILQNGLAPVFVDAELPSCNIDAARIEEALGPKTRAMIVAHTLGNPIDLDRVLAIARRHRLWMIEDCCDALGSKWNDRRVGTFGDISTLSFYPAHHITMGEGGAVLTNDPQLKRILESFRDWGRDCYCAPGRENTCGKRFAWQFGELPFGYDHKYTYSHAGYNLKITDMQAALGLSQLERLDDFIAARKRNFDHLKSRISNLAGFLTLPESAPGADPSWFGFPMTLREDAPVARVDLLRYLDEHKIGTRLLFAGNAVRQPYMKGRAYRVAGSLRIADIIMERTFWVGIWPGLSEAMLDYVAEKLGEFFGIGI